MKRLLILCPYPKDKAPSQRLKYEQYLSAFKENGWEINILPFIDDPFWNIIYKKGNLLKKIFYTLRAYFRRFAILPRINNYDVVYVHLWITPFGPPIFEWIISRLSNRLIYDIDDLIYLSGTKSKAHPIVSFIKGKKKPIYLMRHADHVITCTPYLDKFVRNFNQNTTDISSTINTNLYKPREQYEVDKIPVIGWSGSYSTSKYLHLLDDVFRKLATMYKFKLKVMGDEGFTLDGVDVEAIPWKESYEVEVMKTFDIGVYPLPYEEWVLGKSGLKALQYMSLGIPTVATAYGTIFRIIENGKNGFLVNNEEEWFSYLELLINDMDVRERIGRKAVDIVEKQYSVKSNAATYLNILNGAMKDRDAGIYSAKQMIY